MIERLRRAFENPGAEFRGKPFWSWSGRLEEGELRRQVRAMRRMGLGGFFMHSRVGLQTPYLSAEWFRLVRGCIDEARRLGMEPWLYDEDRWPSGAAGGMVTRDPRFRARTLAMVETRDVAAFQWNRDVRAAVVAEVDGARARNLRPVPRGKRPGRLGTGESLLAFGVCVEEPSSWYNGYTYLDTMNPNAVREFVRVTHEAYRRELSDEDWALTLGIFTDEPNYGRLMDKRKRVSWMRGDAKMRGDADARTVPWTPALPKVFRRRYGYDLERWLSALFLDLDHDSRALQARYHYFDCVTHLFVDSYARQIGEWCDAHGTVHTGHVLGEEPMTTQAWVVGDAMRFYEHMQLPGMDLLTEHEYEFMTAKQVSSVARQFGRKWRLTETYGITGWQFPFLGQKAVGDWQVAMGINLRCQHLAFYTMLGEAKRDYPPSIFDQSPWWELYPKVEDYFARVLSVMTRGEEVRDLLVIHPIESAWLRVNRDYVRFSPENEAFDALFAELYGTFLAENIDFDFGDEEILSRHGRVAKRDGQPCIRVGRAAYRAVAVPPMLTIRRTTLDLLRRFKEAGGTVVFAGGAPPRVDALPSDDAEEFARECVRAPRKGRRLARAVETQCRRVSISDSASGREIAQALHLLREDRDAFYLFVCNTGYRPDRPVPKPRNTTMMRERRAAFPDVRIRLVRGFEGCTGEPLELDPTTGEVFAAEAKRLEVCSTGLQPASYASQRLAPPWEIHTRLPPLGSRLFVIPRRKPGLAAHATGAPKPKPRPRLRVVREKPISTGAWEYSLSEPNCLVLDWPRYRVGRVGQASRLSLTDALSDATTSKAVATDFSARVGDRRDACPTLQEDRDWEGPAEVLRADRAVRAALGIAPRGGQMVQPWAREAARASSSWKMGTIPVPPKDAERPLTSNPPSAPVELLYEFDVETAVSGDFALAIERPGLYEIRLNGCEIDPTTDAGWWVDRSLRRLPIDTAILRIGTNSLTLRTLYNENHPGFEIVYVLGHFGVRRQSEAATALSLFARKDVLCKMTGDGKEQNVAAFRVSAKRKTRAASRFACRRTPQGSRVAIIPLPPTLRLGDWCGQGLPFYSGSVTYRKRFRVAPRPGERLFIRVPEYRGVAIRILVNGQCAGVIGWEPNEVEITEFVRGGRKGDGGKNERGKAPRRNEREIELGIEVLGHRRNSHGPLHHAEREPYWVGPTQFLTKGDLWRDEYQLVACGVMSPPTIIFKRITGGTPVPVSPDRRR